MSWTAHSSVGLAQSIFYVPPLIAASYLLHRHSQPRLPWLALALFSAVRIAGGIVLILFGYHQRDTGYIIAALTLEGTGVVPLILSAVGMAMLIQRIDFATSRSFVRFIVASRLLILAGVAILIAGSVLVGNYKSSADVSTGTALLKAGYIVIVAVLALIVACMGLLGWNRGWLSMQSSLKIFYAIVLSIPFLAIRITYACLGVFHDTQLVEIWSPVYGSIAALVLMHSCTEYLAVVLYLAVGIALPQIAVKKSQSRIIEEEERRH